MSDFRVVIPARYQSSRFPGKLLKTIDNKPIIQYVYQQAMRAGAQSVLIATDDQRIANVADGFGADVCLTSEEHPSGTDRIAQAVSERGYADDEVIVNVQGDEPLLPPALIRQVAQNVHSQQVSMATLCWPIHSEQDWHCPNVVKVVRDINDNALYFTRAAVPFCRIDGPSISGLGHAFRHIGLYGYRVSFLQQYVAWPSADIEQSECLEQLRVLWQGHKIHVATAVQEPPQDINTPADLQRLQAVMQQGTAVIE